MTAHRIAIALSLVLLSYGCGVRSPDSPTLSDGLYTMESSIKKTGVAKDYGDSTQCRVTLRRSELRIEPLEGETNGWYEGTLSGGNIVVRVQRSNPDPMIEGMQLKAIFEGKVTADNYAEGSMKGSAGTNIYLTGTWRLTKKK